MIEVGDIIIVLTGTFTGILIGLVGIGGVLLLPILISTTNLDIHRIIPASSFSFLFTGIVATWIYRKLGRVSFRSSGYLIAGIIPGAVSGALINPYVPDLILIYFFSALLLLTGFRSLIGMKDSNDVHLNKMLFMIIGTIVGFCSSLTGTAGPVLLIPVLLFFHYRLKEIIGLGQVIQIPIAVVASITYFLTTGVDMKLGLMLGFSQGIGVLAGAMMAEKIETAVLKRITSLLLILSGILLISKEWI